MTSPKRGPDTTANDRVAKLASEVRTLRAH